MRIPLNLLLLILLGSCLHDEDGKSECVHLSWKTPGGYSINWKPVGTTEDVEAELDAEVEWAIQWFVAQGHGEAWVRGVAQRQVYDVEDHCAFMVFHPSGVVWASGLQEDCGHLIRLAYYSLERGDVVPPDAPAWTVMRNGYNQRDWWWGNPDKKRLPALRHELGHALFGACFEHTPCSAA